MKNYSNETSNKVVAVITSFICNYDLFANKLKNTRRYGNGYNRE